MIKCVECSFQNPEGSDTCLNCGSRLAGQKLSTAMDDVSGEATVLIGGTPKAGHAASPPPAPSPGAPPSPGPAQPPASPAPPPSRDRGTAPPAPASPYSRDKNSLGIGMLVAVVAGGILVAILLVAILFRFIGLY